MPQDLADDIQAGIDQGAALLGGEGSLEHILVEVQVAEDLTEFPGTVLGLLDFEGALDILFRDVPEP